MSTYAAAAKKLERPPPQDRNPTATTVSVIYFLNLVFPNGFIKAIEKHNPDLARRLQCTKIGQSATIQNFYDKMCHYLTYLPFAKLKYVGYKIDPNKIDLENPFDSEDAEGAMHLLCTHWHEAGEWFDLSNDQRKKVVNRLEGLGCEELTEGEKDEHPLRMGRDQPPSDSDGYVYLAKFGWSTEDVTAIKAVMVKPENDEHKTTCIRMLSTKIGHAKHLKNEDGKGGRGGNYVWATSQLAKVQYTGMTYPHMKKGERGLHKQYKLTNWSGSGEWFYFLGTTIEEDIIKMYKQKDFDNKKVVKGEWSRKKDDNHVMNILKWLKAGLIIWEEKVVLIEQGYILSRDLDKDIVNRMVRYYDHVKESVEWEQ